MLKYKLPKTCDKILYYVYEHEHLPQYMWKPLTAEVIGAQYDDFIQSIAFLETIGLFRLSALYGCPIGYKYIAPHTLSQGARDYVKSVNPKLEQKYLSLEESINDDIQHGHKWYDWNVIDIYTKIQADIDKARKEAPQ